jgi:hypothetical protein
MRRAILIISLVGILALVLGVMAVGAETFRNFGTHLTGADEVPVVVTLAQGQAIFRLSDDGETLSYKLIVANIVDVTQAHIHLKGEGAQTGPVAAWLYPSGPPATLIPGRSNGVLAEGDIVETELVGPAAGMSMADFLAAIQSGRAYVNVHTSANPPGEIRGDLP